MHKLIKMLSLFLCFSLLLGSVAAVEENDMEYYWGNILWRYDAQTQSMTLSAVKGDESDEMMHPWKNLKSSVKTLTIGNDVTELPDEAFFKFGQIQTVTLPDSLHTIGVNAFESCDELRSAEILCSTDRLLGTFFLCKNLETVTIEGVIREYLSTFSACANLKEIRIPDGAERLEGTFLGCNRLNSVDLPDSITVITDGAFQSNWSLKELELPQSLRNIGSYAFAGCCNLEELVIPAGVMQIGSCAFEKNGERDYSGSLDTTYTGVKTLRFTGNPPVFERNAFGARVMAMAAEMTCYYPGNNPKWTEDVLQNYGGKITWIPYEAEDPNPELTGKCGENAYWKYEDGTLTISGTGPMEDYNPYRKPVWWAYWNQLTSVVVEEGITHISDYAFSSFVALKNVQLAQSVESIGESAFSECSGLQRIELPEKLKNIGMGAFSISGLVELEIPETVQDCNSSIVMACYDLESLTFNTGSWLEGSEFTLSGFEKLRKITFASNAPLFYDTGLSNVKAEIYYPKNNATWVKVIQSNYGGDITWVGYLPENAEDNLHPVFEDVHKGRFYYDSVSWAYENGITTGISATKFGPLDSCTRAQVVTFLWRAAGSPKASISEHPFADVKPGAFYYDAMLWAVENGITTGVDENHFAPSSECNRAQVVSFLYRAEGNPAVEMTENPFTDVEEGRYFYHAVAWAVENGITNGVSANEFAPSQICNRGQIVTFLMRAYQ